MKPRDGVWISNGLSAEFRLLYEHPNTPDVYRVDTAAGKCYVQGKELIWDCGQNYENKTKSYGRD